MDLVGAARAVSDLLLALGEDPHGAHLADTPRGVGVVLEAEHACMSLRGVRATGARTTTSALRGRMREDGRTRQEFLALATA